jgi:hypothetical protein
MGNSELCAQQGQFAQRSSLFWPSPKHIFQFLQRLDLNSSSGRSCLEDRLFPGERIDPLPGLCRGFLLDLDLHEPRQRELTRGAFPDMTLNEYMVVP